MKTLDLTWKHVAIAGLIIVAYVVLALSGRDTGALLGLGTLLLAGIGLTTGLQIAQRDQTNGHQSELLRLVRDLADKVATMQPPPT